MKRMLFVNHRTKECGVNQFGKRYYDNFAESKKWECFYIDIDHGQEFEFWANELEPSAVIYNFYSSATMGWFSRALVDKYRSKFKQLCLYHELDMSPFDFDLILHQDPFSEDAFPHWKLPRSIPEFTPFSRYFNNTAPVFGSFGFGLGGKGFGTLVDKVQSEYDIAYIRLHIPFAAFGDKEGNGARRWVEDAKKRIYKPNIELTVSHQFKPEEELLRWLSQNDCNCFLYDENYGRGISSTLDYALAAQRPIAITQSYQFKHVWKIDDSFTVEKHSLREIITAGTKPQDKFREMWSREKVVESFENALESLGL